MKGPFQPLPGDVLQANRPVFVRGQEPIEQGEYVEYEGEDGNLHFVRTVDRETHFVGGLTLGYEVQIMLTEKELQKYFEQEDE